VQGNLIIISSPSGGGKGTLIKEVRTMMPELAYSVSHTTRKQRSGEEDGREYHFVSRDEFEHRIENGEFQEYAEVHGNLYGTSLVESQKIFSSGRDLIVEVDVQGAIQIMAKVPSSVGIFILPPSFDVLRSRLTARGTEAPEALTTRLRNAFDEVLQYSQFRYVVINEVLAIATKQIAAIILGERQCVDRQQDGIRGILDSFDASRSSYHGD